MQSINTNSYAYCDRTKPLVGYSPKPGSAFHTKLTALVSTITTRTEDITAMQARMRAPREYMPTQCGVALRPGFRLDSYEESQNSLIRRGNFFKGIHLIGSVSKETMKDFIREQVENSVRFFEMRNGEINESATELHEHVKNWALEGVFWALVHDNVKFAAAANSVAGQAFSGREADGGWNYFNSRFFFQAKEFLPIIKDAVRSFAEENGLSCPINNIMESDPWLFDTEDWLHNRIGGYYMNFPEGFVPPPDLSIFQDMSNDKLVINGRSICLIEANRIKDKTLLLEWLESRGINSTHFSFVKFRANDFFNQVAMSIRNQQQSHAQHRTLNAYDAYSGVAE